MTRKRKRKKTRIGVNLAVAIGLVLIAAGNGPAALAEAAQAQAEYALIAGTVFREPGFALPGAEVVLMPKPDSTRGKKLKTQKISSDRRGEFVFRVPPGPMEYVLTVTAQGFEPAGKSIRVESSERIDQYFTLKAASQKE